MPRLSEKHNEDKCCFKYTAYTQASSKRRIASA